MRQKNIIFKIGFCADSADQSAKWHGIGIKNWIFNMALESLRILNVHLIFQHILGLHQTWILQIFR
jgi:hypothetical protein